MTPGCVKHVRSVLVRVGSADSGVVALAEDFPVLSSKSVRFRYAVAYNGTSGGSFCTSSYSLIILSVRHIHRTIR